MLYSTADPIMSQSEPTPHQNIETLYIQNHRWLQGWMHKKLGCSFRAADLMHDTFVRLLGREKKPHLEQPAAYLMTVAKRVLVDHWRREQLEQAYLEALQQLPEAVAPSAELQHEVFNTLLEIDQRLDGLATPVKQAFLLARLDGMKLADIAARLNLSQSTVKRYLVQASAQCYFSLSVDQPHPDAPHSGREA